MMMRLLASPNNENNLIYFAHASRNESSDIYYETLSSPEHDASHLVDCIALNEKFSYEIKTVGNNMTVKLMAR